GVELRLDLISASRAHGISNDVVDTPQGPGFKIENPNASNTCGCGESFSV
ncbi:MAG: iron-sulfur cluster assembly accessory protein, partial [Gammaproteobacteria bacterium]